MLSEIKEKFFRRGRTVWGKHYRALPIKSDYRVHDVAFNIIKTEIGSRKRIKVLDIATGTGAFAQRISDNFPAWDLEINDFENQATGVSFKKYSSDLNRDFRDKFSGDGYDLIVAIEILEHLENPWHFLREVRKLLRKDGILILSTPNVDSTLDRLTYLIDGHPFYFGERGYTNSGGHITPIPDWLFRRITKDIGFPSVKIMDAVDTKPHIGLFTTLKLWIIMPFSALYMRNINNRSINVYLCRQG